MVVLDVLAELVHEAQSGFVPAWEIRIYPNLPL